MLDQIHASNARLRDRLNALTSPQVRAGQPIDVVITMNEINHRHGTGPLLQRVLNDRRPVFSIRTRNDYGFQEYGHWNAIVSHREPSGEVKSPEQVRQRLKDLLAGRRVDRILCVPYLPDELSTAIAIHDFCSAPVCTWIMDDQNVAARRIPDELMREALQKSALRLGTHPELCRAYEDKFGLPFHILPAVVPDRLVFRGEAAGRTISGPSPDQSRALLIGSIWDQVWFDRLCASVAGSGLTIDWFGNSRSPWVRFGAQEMDRAGIRPRGVIPEERLSEELRNASLAIVPVSPLDGSDSNPGVARLSLPGRILFVAAASCTPVLVMGGKDTCGARFVKHFGVGEVIPYDSDSFRAACARLGRPEVQVSMRARAAALAPALSDGGVSEWLLASTLRGLPADRRFEDVFADYEAVMTSRNGGHR